MMAARQAEVNAAAAALMEVPAAANAPAGYYQY